jgi:hypothetical protein
MHSLTKVIIVLFFSINYYSSIAQDFPSEIWHHGYAVLIEGDTIQGKIKYDFKNDLIQLDRNGVLKTYAARKILYFKIKDELAKNYRIFYALPYQIHSEYEAPIFFEILYEGNLSLLSREEIITDQTSTRTDYYYYPTPYPTNYYREKLAYKFFFLEEKGTIVYYTLKKNDLMLFFGRYSKQVSQYMKKNHLKHDNLRDLVRITAYYNALVGS